MIEIEVNITSPKGLHTRPAARLVQTAASFKCKVTIAANGKVIDGKSILSIMGMVLAQNTKVKIRAEGEDEEECIAALKELIENNFDEEEE